MRKKIKNYLFHAFVFCVLSFCLMQAAYAQNSGYILKGKVIDKTTKMPLAGASIFAQNTTLGSVTDAFGNYTIILPDGGYSLVVTYTGYETANIRISASSPGIDTLLFELQPHLKSLEEVSVSVNSEVKDGWKKYGLFFTKNFIGQSGFARQSVFRNPEALHFFFSKRRNRLKILADEPLVVDNFALGYTIRFLIDSFTTEYNSGTNLFVGYPRFEEMTGTPYQMETWAANRAIAYEGSMLHFMRSLYSRSLEEDGFEIRFILKMKGKDTSVALTNLYGALNYIKDDNQTVRFYPNYPTIVVKYKWEIPSLFYLKLDTTANKLYQLSSLTFSKGKPITIEPNGYYYNQENIITNGYLGFKKIGDMVPYNYHTE